MKWLGIALSGFFLWITFKEIQVDQVMGHVGPRELLYFLFGLMTYIPFIYVRGILQKSNLRFIKPDLRRSHSISAVASAFFFNSIFPARLGEVVRARVLKQTEGLPLVTVLSTVLVEKILDLAVILMLILGLLIGGVVDFQEGGPPALAMFVAVLLSAVVAIATYVWCNDLAIRLAEKFVPKRFRPLLLSINEKAIAGFALFRARGQVAYSGFLLILSWCLVGVAFWFVCQPYVTQLGLPPYTCLVLMAAQAVALSVPSAPAGIGVVHYSTYVTLKLLLGPAAFTDSLNLVLAFVLFLHLAMVMLDLLAGGLWLAIGLLGERLPSPDKLTMNAMVE